MDVLPQQNSESPTNIQASRGKIPLEIKEYIFRTCGEYIFNRLFDRYEEETGEDCRKQGRTSPEAYQWVVKNLKKIDFDVILMLAEDELNYGLEKDRQHNLHPDFREAILKRHLEEQVEKQILEG